MSRVATKIIRRGITISSAPQAEARKRLQENLFKVDAGRLPQPTIISSLSNGARVASEASTGETATIALWVGSGTAYESAENEGIARFFSHLTLRGTKKRTAAQVHADFAALGGNFGVHTGRERSVVWATVHKNNVGPAVELLSDVFQNSGADEATVNREKVAFAKAVGGGTTDDSVAVIDHLYDSAYQGSPLSHTLHGPVDNVTKLSKSDLTAFAASHRAANRVVLVGAGAVDHQQLADLAKQHLGGLHEGDISTPAKHAHAPKPNVFIGSDKRIRYDSLPLAHVAIAFQTGDANSEHVFPLLASKALIGSWTRTGHIGKNSASRLIQELVEEEEGIHSVHTFYNQHNSTGLFGVQFVAADNQLNHTTYHVLSNLVRLVHEVSDEEVSRAKATLFTQIQAHQSSRDVASQIGEQLLAHGRRIPVGEALARVAALKTDDIKETANRVINDEDHVLAAIGPIFELPDYNWIRRRSYWHRY